MFSVFTSTEKENPESKPTSDRPVNFDKVSESIGALDLEDSEASKPPLTPPQGEPSLEEQLKKEVFKRTQFMHCLSGFDRFEEASEATPETSEEVAYSLEKRFRSASKDDYEAWRTYIRDNEVWRVSPEVDTTQTTFITLETSPVSEVDYRLAKQRSSRTSVFCYPDKEYRTACLDPNLLNFCIGDSPVVPVEAMRMVAERNGLTANDLYLDAAFLKKYGVDMSLQEMLVLDDKNQFDLSQFSSERWTDSKILEAVKTAKVDAAYWVSMAFASQLSNNPRDKVIANTLKRALPHMTMPVVHAMGLTLPYSKDVEDLGRLCNVLLTFSYDLESSLVSQGPIEYALAATASAMALFGAYRHQTPGAEPNDGGDDSILTDYEKRVASAIKRSEKNPGSISSWLWSKIEFLLSIPTAIKNYVRDFFSSMISRTFEVLSGGWEATSAYIRSFSKTILLTGALIVAATGVVAYSTIRTAMSPFGSLPAIPEDTVEFVAQGSLNTAVYVMALVAGFSYFPIGKYNHLKSYADWVKHIVMIGSGCNTILSSVAACVPFVVRRFFFHMFATEEDLRIEMITELTSFMNRLHECSSNPDVIAVPEYRLLVDKAMDQAYTIIEHNLIPKDRVSAMCFNSVFARLLSVHKHFVGVGEGRIRNLPFTLHLYGEPGVGKTRIACQVAKALGFKEEDLYKRPKGPHWNGFGGERVIMCDEHLVGDATQVNTEALTHLDLVGDKEFFPPMASVDNPSVGIKGTRAKPDLVITMNNSFNTPVNHISDDALLRRRSAVVQMVVLSDAHKKSDGSLDLGKYSVEEIRKVAWAAFKFHSSVKEDTVNLKKGWMNYTNLTKELNELRNEHIKVGKKVSEADLREAGIDGHELGRQLLVRSLNRMNEESSLMVDAVQLVSAGLTAQGPEDLSAQGRKYKRPEVTTPPTLSSDEVSRSSGPETDSDANSVILETVSPWSDPPEVVPDIKTKELVSPDDSFLTSQVIPLVHRAKETVESPKASRIMRSFMQLGALVVGAVVLAKSVNMVIVRHRESKAREGSWSNADVKKSPEEKTTVSSAEVDAIEGQSSTTDSGQFKSKRALRSRKARERADADNNWRQSGISTREWSMAEQEFLHGQGGPTIVRIQYGAAQMKAVGLQDNILLTYAHGLHDIEGKLVLHDTIIVYMGNKNWECEVSREDFFFYKKEDIAVIRVRNKQMPCFRNCVKTFVTDDEVADSTSLRVLFGDPQRAISLIVDMRHDITYTLQGESKARITLENAWYYVYDTTHGDCGKLLCSIEGKTSGKYLGIHVAGSGTPGVRKALATLVTREMIEHAINRIKDPPDHSQVQDLEDGQLQSQGNLLYETFAPKPLIAHPMKTRVRDSALKKYLSDPSSKLPPVLEKGDPRSDGSDPVKNFLSRVDGSKPWVKVESSLLCDIGDDLYRHVMENTVFPVKPRRLTIEEAVAGLPGVLKSMNAATSLGLPYKVTHAGKGKTAFFSFNDRGKLVMSEEFRGLVERKLIEIERGENPSHVWCGALKDEPLAPEKIASAKTRVIFAGDVVSMTAFRMHFGTILAGFNNPNSDNGVCIGLNQYSYDMDLMFKRLRGDLAQRFVAGDFRGFDIHYVTSIVNKAYDIIRRIVEYYDLDTHALDYMRKYDLESPGVLGNTMFRAYTMLFSGGLLTTIINCLVNQLYVRYAFRRAYPELDFDENIKIITHGDDHVVNVLNPNIDFDGVVMAELLSEINQEYTGDDKKAPRPGYRSFEDITFLGSSPIKFNGKYVGKMSSSTISGALSFTNDNDASLVQICQQIGEYASMHSAKYFDRISSEMNLCFKSLGLDRKFNAEGLSQDEIRVIVAERTAYNGFDYSVNQIDGQPRVSMDSYTFSQGEFVAQGDVQPQGSSASYMTEFQTAREVSTTQIMGHNNASSAMDSYIYTEGEFVAQGDHQGTGDKGYMTEFMTTRRVDTKQSMGENNASSAMSQPPNSLTTGTDSAVPRATFEWSSTDTVGTVLFSATSPWGMLGLGNTTGLQNMPFDNNVYSRSDQKAVIQVSGKPEVAGSICAYWYPLSSATNLVKTNWTTCEHVLLSANANTTATLEIPYMYPKPVMRTAQRDDTHINGTFVIAVLSPLRSASNTTVTVRVYSAFPNAEFFLPKAHSGLVAQGNVQTSNVRNEYHVGDVLGSMPIQTGTGTDQGATSKNVASLPMDKTPLFSGAVPTADQFPGMSRNVGVVPTVGMQLDPSAMYRKSSNYFSREQMTIEHITSKPILHEVREVLTTDAIDKQLIRMDLNSILTDGPEPLTIGANLAILNTFYFWRADLIFDIMLVKTRFHSCRLRFTTGYGEETTANMVSDPNAFITTVLDYSGESDVQSVRVPYNAASEYLRTFSGFDEPNYFENQSMGQVTINVQNVLTAPDTVNSSVQVLIFVRLANVSVAVPRPVPFWHVLDGQAGDPKQLVAQGDIQTLGVGTGAVADEVDEAETVSIVKDSTQIPTKPCRLKIGSRFENTPATTVELDRRYIQTSYSVVGRNSEDTIQNFNDTVFNFAIRPRGVMSRFFCAWAGSMNVRFYQHANGHAMPTTFTPLQIVPTETGDNIMGHIVNMGSVVSIPTDGTIPASTLELTSTRGFGVPVAREMTYPIGQGAWIDITVPYQSELDFMPLDSGNSGGPFDIYGDYLGLLSIPRHFSDTGDYPDEFVFLALGDDATYGIYRPPLSIVWAPVTGTAISENVRTVGGYYNPNSTNT